MEVTLKASSRFAQPFEFTVDDRGNFSITDDDGSTYTDITLDGVMEKVKKGRAKAKVKLDIPVTVIGSGHTLEDGIITGIHGGSGNLLVRMASGGTAQMSYGQSVLQRMASADRELYEKATGAIEDLQRKLNEMEKRYGWDEHRDAKAYVQSQIAAAHKAEAAARDQS